MKTLITKDTKVSLYIFDDAEVLNLTETSIEVGTPPKLIIGDLNSSVAEVLTVSIVPSDWKGGAYKLEAGAWVRNVVPAGASQLSAYTASVQAHLDAEAQKHNYDGILSACTYATSSVPRFAAEGQACILWRDQVWATCYKILNEVNAGTRTPPDINELLAELPVIAWPVVG